MADPFDGVWSEIEHRIARRTRIPNWTRDKGLFGEDFDVELSTDSLIVCAPGADNVQRVPREDFRVVYELWSGYLSGAAPRKQVREATRYSKYIISILHWLGAVPA